MRKSMKIFLIAMCMFTLNMSPAFAASVSTAEFGTFTYYSSGNGTGIGARTEITKTSKSIYLQTKGDLVNYDTGKKLDSDYDDGFGIKKTRIILWPEDSGKFKGFFTHEARGVSSVAKYTSAVLTIKR